MLVESMNSHAASSMTNARSATPSIVALDLIGDGEIKSP